MRMLLIYILLSFGCQQTTFVETENLKTSKSELESENLKTSKSELESENLKTSKSEKGQKSESRKVTRAQWRKDAGAQSSEAQSSQLEVQNTSQVFNFSDSQIQKDSQVFSFSDSQIQHYENQIRLADSLYKNYLPQYNFDEVKAAMEFFDSLTADNRQQSTDNRLRARKTKCTEDTRPCVSTGEKVCYPRTVDCCPLTVDIEFSCAKAHYYHAVGLTERDDIVGACEHYFKALEIMETELETENLKTSKSEKRIKSQGRKVTRTQGRKDAGAQSSEAQSSQLEAQSTSQFFSFSDSQKQKDSQVLNNPQNYEKIRFLALTYTRLACIFSDKLCFSLAQELDYKAYHAYRSINDTISFLYASNNLGMYFYADNKIEQSRYWYNKTISESPQDNIYVSTAMNGLAQIYYDEGKIDTAIYITKELIKKSDGSDRCSFEYSLAEIYYKSNQMDSALSYAKKAFESDYEYTKIASSAIIHKIYDFHGMHDSSSLYKDFYIDNTSSFITDNDEIVSLLSMYNEYKSSNEYTNKTNIIIFSFIILVALIILFRHVLLYNKRKSLSKSLNGRYLSLLNNEVIITIKESLHQENIKTKVSVNNYKQYKLSKSDHDNLIMIIDNVYPNFSFLLRKRYSKLSNLDINYCVLILLGFTTKEIFVLMGVEYSTSSDRYRYLRKLFNTKDVQSFLLNFIEKKHL